MNASARFSHRPCSAVNPPKNNKCIRIDRHQNEVVGVHVRIRERKVPSSCTSVTDTNVTTSDVAATYITANSVFSGGSKLCVLVSTGDRSSTTVVFPHGEFHYFLSSWRRLRSTCTVVSLRKYYIIRLPERSAHLHNNNLTSRRTRLSFLEAAMTLINRSSPAP